MRCKRYKRAAYKVKSERNKITRRILRARNRISRNRISHLWTRGNIPHRSSVRNTLFVIAGFRSKTRINGGDYRKLIFSPRLRALERLFAGKQKHPLKRDYEDFFFPFLKHAFRKFKKRASNLSVSREGCLDYTFRRIITNLHSHSPSVKIGLRLCAFTTRYSLPLSTIHPSFQTSPNPSRTFVLQSLFPWNPARLFRD